MTMDNTLIGRCMAAHHEAVGWEYCTSTPGTRATLEHLAAELNHAGHRDAADWLMGQLLLHRHRVLVDPIQAAAHHAGASMTIPNRDHQHGGMEAVGQLAQSLKIPIHHGTNWYLLTPGEQEALDMICHKIARILSGADPHDQQHWEDVAGYAQAVMRSRESQPDA